MSDGRLHTLQKADQVEVESERKRYSDTAATMEDAIVQLGKIIDGHAEDNQGQWIEGLKKNAQSIKDDLVKARVRYADAANLIYDYEPELRKADEDAKAALRDEDDGNAQLTTAKNLPEAVKSPDGTYTPEEQAKKTKKENDTATATDAVTAAKNRLTAVLDALDVAGKRLGDGANCDNYDDGLTDTSHDKLMEVLGWVSKIMGYLALALTILAFIFPGVGALAIAGVIAGALLLVSDSILFANGETDLKTLLLDIFGLGLAGLGAGLGKIFAALGTIGKVLKGLGGAEGGLFKFVKPFYVIGDDGVATLHFIKPFKPLTTFGPKPYFFSKPGQYAFWKDASSNWWKDVSGIETWKGITGTDVISGLFNFSTTPFKVIWGLFTFGNNGFNLGAGIGYTGYTIWKAKQDG